jgi:murein DD-endopeptidase MepM/ murein hydrolase activator NlpD
MERLLAPAVSLAIVAILLVAATGTAIAEPSEREAASTNRYGIAARGLETVADDVAPRETFADLLLDRGVSYSRIVALAEETRGTFDVRDIRAGRSYRVYMNPWTKRAEYLVYRPNAVEYVVFNVRRPDASYVGERPVDVQWRTARGTIERSLYETMVDAGAHPGLVLRLSEVFAWQIDFFRLRKGDRFRIVYEERTVDGRRISPGEIIAAAVTHRGETYYGFRFDEGTGTAEFFDRNGNSLRRALLKAPLQFSRISSRFTNRRMHPVLKEYRPHRGTDYAAPRGTPVRSVGDGEVLYASYKGPNGHYVKIRHNGTYTTGYLHLSGYADGIRPGARVAQGDVIGYVGSTGRSTGPHLDYRLWKHGTAVDPYRLEMPPSHPVQPQHRAAFERVVRDLMEYLRSPALLAGLKRPTPAS